VAKTNKKINKPQTEAADSQMELERRVFHLRTLYDVTREIGFLRDTQQIIKNLLLMVMGAFGALRGVILIVDNSGKVEAVTERGMDDQFLDKVSQAIKSGYSIEELKDGASIQILGGSNKNQKKKQRNITELLSSFEIHIWSPFKINDDLRGGIGLGEKLSGDPYTADDHELIRTLSNHGVMAVQSALIHQDVVRYAEELETSLKRIQILESIKANLSKFVPQTVQNLIEEAPEAPLLDKHEADVSVLFADMTGYTRLSEQMEQEQVNKIVERYFGAFLDEILKQGGDVNETAGDGLMVIFQHSDPRRHASAAVLAALGIQRRTREINGELEGQLPSIAMHVGVNSGIASVGATKIEGMAGTRWTYTASGTTTNVAARLSALVQGEGVILSQETRSRIGDGFDLHDLGPQALKNVSVPIRVYRLTGGGLK